MERFFIVVPPGLEAEAEIELREVWADLLDPSARPHAVPLPEVEVRRGGLEIETDPFAAVQLNFFLKTPSRILWRLDSFKVRDFPKLHQKLSRIDVAARLGTKEFDVKAAATGSRLGHERRIEETARSAWKIEGRRDDAAVYLRIDDDECTVSLDTSGEHLHRRGLNLARGEAPVRETLAAFCLRKLMAGVPATQLRHIGLFDPMCGSGTFLTEAMTLWTGHFQRPYRFQTFRGLPKLFQQPLFSRNYLTLPAAPFAAVEGFDREAKVIEAARANLARARLASPKAQGEAHVRDLFAEESVSREGERWVVCNPPYGERLEMTSPQEILDRMLEVHRPTRIGLLWTEPVLRRLRWPAGLVKVSESPLSNGGIDSAFVVYRIPQGASAPRVADQ